MKKYVVVLQLFEFNMYSKKYDTREEAEQVAKVIEEAQFLVTDMHERVVIEEEEA